MYSGPDNKTHDLRLTDQEFLQNHWHRFGLLGALQVLADRSCASTCREFPPRRMNEITDTFLSGSHALQCSSCGTLKRHNSVLKGPIAANLTKQGYNFNTEHTIAASTQLPCGLRGHLRSQICVEGGVIPYRNSTPAGWTGKRRW